MPPVLAGTTNSNGSTPPSVPGVGPICYVARPTAGTPIEVAVPSTVPVREGGIEASRTSDGGSANHADVALAKALAMIPKSSSLEEQQRQSSELLAGFVEVGGTCFELNGQTDDTSRITQRVPLTNNTNVDVFSRCGIWCTEIMTGRRRLSCFCW
jgi:hypothetical protein